MQGKRKLFKIFLLMLSLLCGVSNKYSLLMVVSELNI
uniref:Uncharacterized protein n=1 Tax=Arundo donax TaxID=35708 RepID=A0A0A8YZV3_ARUDO